MDSMSELGIGIHQINGPAVDSVVVNEVAARLKAEAAERATPRNGWDSALVVEGLTVVDLTASDVRWDRVNFLQGSIAAGTYSVSAADLADKLMQVLHV